MAKSFKIFLVTGILLVLGGLAAPLQAQNRTVSGVSGMTPENRCSARLSCSRGR